MNRRQKIIVSVTGIFIVLLILLGLTYAYFLTRITGNSNPTSISVTTANLELVYGDGTTAILTSETPLMPSSTPIGTKDFTVTNNGDDSEYVVVFEDVTVKYAADTVIDGETVAKDTPTTFDSNDFVYTLTCTVKDKSGNTLSDKSCDGVENGSFPMDGGIVLGNSIDKDDVHSYVLTLYYLDNGLDQSADMNKALNGKVNIKDIKSINPYSENTSSLAYNIINNSMLNKNGTELVSTLLSGIATSTSGKNYNTTITESTATISSVSSTYGAYYWTYADDYKLDEKNGFTLTGVHTCKYSECYGDLTGKYLVSNSASSNGYAIDSTRTTTGLTTIYKVTTAGTSATSSISLAKYTISSKDIEEKTLSTTVDDLGVSYYYRGDVQDNYVNFAGMCWKIVRIEGDGSVKLILEDQYTTCNDAEDTDGSGTTDYAYTGNWVLGYGPYGYTYDEDTDTYRVNYLNYEGGMADKFEEFQTNKLSGVTDKLKSGNWCYNDIAYEDEAGLIPLLDKTNHYDNKKSFHYDSYTRLHNKREATLKCNGTIMDKYRTNNDMYVGTITADEIVYAGGKVYSSNEKYYLINDYQYDNEEWFWSLSPNGFDGLDYAFLVSDYGDLSDASVEYYSAFRPAVSLKSSTTIVQGGEGTKTNPYVIG